MCVRACVCRRGGLVRGGSLHERVGRLLVGPAGWPHHAQPCSGRPADPLPRQRQSPPACPARPGRVWHSGCTGPGLPLLCRYTPTPNTHTHTPPHQQPAPRPATCPADIGRYTPVENDYVPVPWKVRQAKGGGISQQWLYVQALAIQGQAVSHVLSVL